MKIRQLECFCALAETLSFTEAARQLYITQSAFSKNIAALEDELGCILITRSKTMPALTSTGKDVYRHAREILIHLKKIRQYAQSAQSTSKIPIRIGILSGGLHRKERYLLSEYSAKHENILIEVNEYSPNDLFHALEAGIADTAIFIGHKLPILNNYRHISIQENPTCLICSKYHRLAARHSIRLSDLSEDSFIILGKQRSADTDRDSLIFLCRQNGFSPRISIYADSPFILLDYIEQGLGISMMGSDAVTVSRHDLKAIPIENVPPSHHWLLAKKGTLPSHLTEFLHFMETTAQ